MSNDILIHIAVGGVTAVLVVAAVAVLIRFMRKNTTGSAGQAYLQWNKDGFARAYEITKGVTRIGRDKSNDLVLRHMSISRFHAKLVKSWTGGFKIVDENSSNHVFIEGRPVEKGRLEDGTEFKIGSVSLEFTLQPPESIQHQEESPPTPVHQTRCRRKTDRRDISVGVRFCTDKTGWERGTATNISSGGMFIETQNSGLHNSDYVEIVFRAKVEHKTHWLRFLGKVIHQSDQGAGIAFERLDRDSEILLKALNQAA